MEPPAVYEAYNWIAMYKLGYDRIWVTEEGVRKSREWKVWDEANESFIEYMESEKSKYIYSKKRNCYVLPKVE